VTLAGLLNTRIVVEGFEWCRRNPDAHADCGDRLSKEAIILYSMMNAVTLGAKGIRVNCTRSEVTETPILDLIAGNLATQDATDVMRFVLVHAGFHAAWCWTQTIAPHREFGDLGPPAPDWRRR
jgi:hypothetical protein